jgi:hypothetical protein
MNLPDKLRFDRHELAGAFGDIGTDLPLIAGILLATKLDATGVFLAFGLAQIASGLRYGLPMPVQPLKAMAVVVIAGQAGGGLLQLAGLMSGVLMLLLSVSGLLDRLQGLIPVVVVRGVQAGLGLALARTAFGLAGRESTWGWIAAALAVGLLLWLRGHRRVPGSLVVVGVGVLWAAIYRIDWPALVHGFGWVAPRPAVLPWDQWLAALMVLVLPQLPLSLSNSVFATQRTVADLFPERPVTLRGLGRTYSLMNLLSPWIGGIPMLGARTGGSVVIYGSLYLVIGAGFSGAFQEVLRAFPAPVLGAILLVEAGVLLLLLRDLVRTPGELGLAAVVALICVFAPQGYFTGMIVGSGLFYASRRRRPASAATPAGAPG